MDDPLFTLSGERYRRRRMLLRALLWTAVAGFPIAWSKADTGTSVKWIGIQWSVAGEYLHVGVTDEKSEEVTALTQRLNEINSCPTKDIQRLAGILSFIATAVPHLKPFVDPLWAEISRAKSRCVSGRSFISTDRVRHAVSWIQGLMRARGNHLFSTFKLGLPLPKRRVVWLTDASPWGLGGVLLVEGRAVACFASKLTRADAVRLHAKIGESKYMPRWEALALLVAAKLWHSRVSVFDAVIVKGDNLGVTYDVAKHRARDPMVSLILRELALVESQLPLSSQSICMAAHIPGGSNGLADALSRLWAPEPLAFPPELRNAERCTPQKRGTKFWHTVFREEKSDICVHYKVVHSPAGQSASIV